MKAVLISIQPKWCELIASGKKTIEVRKTKPKIDVPFKCYIYCTNTFNRNGLFPKQMLWQNNKICNGKVIGELVCDRIEGISKERLGSLSLGEFEDVQNSCLREQQIYDYCGKKEEFYLWHISDLVIYDNPKELREFYKADICKHYDGGCDCWSELCKTAQSNDCHCGHTKITRPPQSWCYVEHLKAARCVEK